ncbi:hypothetical protein BCR44DRAFT_76732 [Catenaria anguillulae PL171]|uniref:Tryptophan-rich sensory protein n=1 Tax=Catenaria anguillulae PL171 TaxID=765915 RepID=A0A1Y2HZE1_9FUNG|nr:hypothetical protein BCR44DRAFT_76732 [Catenaria anguillulae PL171]
MTLYAPLNTIDVKSVESRLPKVFGAPMLRVLNFVALIAVFVINGLGSSTVLSGRNTQQISDSFPNWLVPAGTAFSIWGVIYFFLAAWGIYQLLPRSYEDVAYNQGVGWVFLGNAALNIAWICVFAFRFPALSILLISGVLATNAVVYYRLKTKDPNPTWANYLCGHVGFSFYTAWLIGTQSELSEQGATVVNAFAVATTQDLRYIGETIAALVLVGVIEIFVTLWSGDAIITGVGCWTLCWIYAKNSTVDMLGTSALVLAIILGCVSGIMWIHRIYRVVTGKGGDYNV